MLNRDSWLIQVYGHDRILLTRVFRMFCHQNLKKIKIISIISFDLPVTAFFAMMLVKTHQNFFFWTFESITCSFIEFEWHIELTYQITPNHFTCLEKYHVNEQRSV